MDTQTYSQGQSQAAKSSGGPIANVPLPNLSGQANGAIGESSWDAQQREASR